MKSKLIMALFILAATIAFSGCSMMGMHGFAGMSHHNMGQIDTTIIKQFEQNGLSGELTVPIFIAGKTALLRLLLEDENGPVSNALVDFSFENSQDNAAETIQIEGGREGLYEAEYTPASIGPLMVTSEIYGLPQAEVVRVHVQQNVSARQQGMWSGSTKYVLGGLAMGLMMLWMSGTAWR